MIDDRWSFSLILYYVRYFYLTNRARKILADKKCLVLIDTKTISPLEIAGVVIVRPGISEAVLVIAHARFTDASVAIEVASRLFFAAFRTSLCFHGYAPFGRL